MKINLQLFATKTIEQLAQEVMQGKHGVGQARKNSLGSNYAAVQALVNSMVKGTSAKTTTTTAPKATTPATTTSNSIASSATNKYKQDTDSAYSAIQNYEDFKSSDALLAKEQNKINSENTTSNYGNFEYNLQQMYDDIMNKALNREKFSYDVTGDALYQQYKDQYINQGKMAMMDTMGQAAAMTGGYGNSYAQSVGQQAYQGYLQQLNDKIPELYQLALNRYNAEGDELRNQFAMLSDDRTTKYNEWNDGYTKAVADRDYYGTDYYKALEQEKGDYTDKYNRLVDLYDAASKAYSTGWDQDYKLSRDAIEDALNERQMAVSEGNLKLSQDEFKWKKEQAQTQAEADAAAANELWYPTGTYDDNGNPIFRNSDGKTQAFGSGVNPYTGTTHNDAKGKDGKVDPSKVMSSNGYQPNNINGVKLKDSGISTNITGKNQTIWQANGKYWLWRGDLNKYVEVDISDLD